MLMHGLSFFLIYTRKEKMKKESTADWLLPTIIFAIIFLLTIFWSDKNDQEIKEYIRNNSQPTISEMK